MRSQQLNNNLLGLLVKRSIASKYIVKLATASIHVVDLGINFGNKIIKAEKCGV